MDDDAAPIASHRARPLGPILEEAVMSVAMNVPDTSAKLKQDYDRDGYIAIRPFFDAMKMVEINRELNRFIAEVAPTMPPAEVYYEDKSNKSSIKQMMRLENYDPYFRDLLKDGAVQALAETVLGEKAEAVYLEYFNKPPGVSKPTPPHQDGYYFKLNPSRAVTGWLALEDVDEENGCLHYVRGSHRAEGYRPHGRSEILGFSQGIVDFGTPDDVANTVGQPGQAGMLLMHDCKTVHWASENKSPTRSRRAIGFVYYGESAKPDEEARAAYKAKLEADLKAAGKI
jgi:phytanoyl-CoA hydroxylase